MKMESAIDRKSDEDDAKNYVPIGKKKRTILEIKVNIEVVKLVLCSVMKIKM